MLKEYSQVATSKSQQELDILVQSKGCQFWKDQLKIAEIQPRATYSVNMFEFKHIFMFFLRTVPDIGLLTIWSDIKITFYTSYLRGSDMLRCGESVPALSSQIRWLKITEPLWSRELQTAKL